MLRCVQRRGRSTGSRADPCGSITCAVPGGDSGWQPRMAPRPRPRSTPLGSSSRSGCPAHAFQSQWRRSTRPSATSCPHPQNSAVPLVVWAMPATRRMRTRVRTRRGGQRSTPRGTSAPAHRGSRATAASAPRGCWRWACAPSPRRSCCANRPAPAASAPARRGIPGRAPAPRSPPPWCRAPPGCGASCVARAPRRRARSIAVCWWRGAFDGLPGLRGEQIDHAALHLPPHHQQAARHTAGSSNPRAPRTPAPTGR